MGRNSAGWCGLLAMVALASQPVEAGDLKSPTRATKAVLVTPSSAPVAPANDASQSAVTIGLFENGASVRADRGSSRETEKAPREHKAITLFHFNSQFGDVAVQPVFGHINGAQLSVGF